MAQKKKKPVQCSHEAGNPSENHETRKIRLHLFTSNLNDKRVGVVGAALLGVAFSKDTWGDLPINSVLEPTTSEPSRVILPHTRPPGGGGGRVGLHGPGTTKEEEEDAGFFSTPPPRVHMASIL